MGYLRKEGQDFRASKPLADKSLTSSIDAMNLKHALGEIKPNRANLHDGRSLSLWRSLRRPRYGSSLPLSRSHWPRIGDFRADLVWRRAS
jgi:hypothetical protein